MTATSAVRAHRETWTAPGRARFLLPDCCAVDLVVVAVTPLAAGHRGQQGAEQDEDRGDDAAGSELVGRDWDPGQADAVEYVVLRPEHGPEHESDDRDREPDEPDRQTLLAPSKPGHPPPTDPPGKEAARQT